MVSRPTSITVIGWYLIGFSLLGAFGYATVILRAAPHTQEVLATNPIPPPILHAMVLGGSTLNIVCGYFMLKGQNWARYVYVSWSVLHLAIVFFTSSAKMSMIPGAVILAAITIFLFLPAANTFF